MRRQRRDRHLVEPLQRHGLVALDLDAVLLQVEEHPLRLKPRIRERIDDDAHVEAGCLLLLQDLGDAEPGLVALEHERLDADGFLRVPERLQPHGERILATLQHRDLAAVRPMRLEQASESDIRQRAASECRVGTEHRSGAGFRDVLDDTLSAAVRGRGGRATGQQRERRGEQHAVHHSRAARVSWHGSTPSVHVKHRVESTEMKSSAHSWAARCRQDRRLAILAIAATLLGGCASTPDARELRSESVRFRTTDGAPAVEDRRAEFRAVFCDELREEGLATGEDASCGRWLWRLPDERDSGSDEDPVRLESAAAGVVHRHRRIQRVRRRRRPALYRRGGQAACGRRNRSKR